MIPALPFVSWTPEARRADCQRFGQTVAEFEAQLADENARMALAWADFRRRRPNGTRRQFALEQVEAAAFEVATLAGATPARARVVARNARRMAEERAP